MTNRNLEIHNEIFNRASSARRDLKEVSSFSRLFLIYEIEVSSGRFPSTTKYSEIFSNRMAYLFENYIKSTPTLETKRTVAAELYEMQPFCAYCRSTESQQIDHFLSQSDWPEYSIYLSNLVPACGRCNVNKRDYKFEIHPLKYGPRRRFTLDVKLALGPHGPAAHYFINARFPNDPQINSLLDQFARIKYQERYGAQAIIKVAKLRSESMKLNGSFSEADFIASCKNTVKFLSANMDKDHWSVILCKHLLRCAPCRSIAMDTAAPEIKCGSDSAYLLPVS